MARPRKLPSGMQLRGEVYYAAFRSNGRLIRKKLASDFKTAKELLVELKARASRAEFNIIDNDYSLADLQAEYLRHVEQTVRPSTAKSYRASLEIIVTWLLNVAPRVSQISADLIQHFRRERLMTTKGKKSESTISPRTVNKDVAALSAMLNYGVDHRLIGFNPLKKLKPLPEDAKCKVRRALTLAEVESLFANSPERLKPVWRMFAITGIRRSELVNMRFDDVDKEARCVTVRATTAKNHKERTIPLDDTMLAAITALENSSPDSEFVFTSNAGTPLRNNLLREFYRACKHAGITDGKQGGAVDLHSLRVTFTTLSLDHGANPKAVQEILGHSTLSLTMNTYAKATERGKREAVGSIPFAKVSTPEHVVSLPDVRKECASNSAAAQTQAAKHVG